MLRVTVYWYPNYRFNYLFSLTVMQLQVYMIYSSEFHIKDYSSEIFQHNQHLFDKFTSAASTCGFLQTPRPENGQSKHRWQRHPPASHNRNTPRIAAHPQGS